MHHRREGYGECRPDTPESLPDLLSDDESVLASSDGEPLLDLHELPDFLEVESPTGSRSSTPSESDSMPNLEPVGQEELARLEAGEIRPPVEHGAWHGVYYMDDPDFHLVARFAMEQRLDWWLEFVATGQPSRFAVSHESWDSERARLLRRAEDLELWLFGPLSLPRWHPEVPQHRRELARIYSLLTLYTARQNFHAGEYERDEAVREWEARLEHALTWSVSERDTLRLEDMGRVCPRAARLTLDDSEADSTARYLEQVMAFGVSQRHTAVRARAAVGLLRRHLLSETYQPVEQPPYLQERPGLGPTGEEKEMFYPAYVHALVGHHNHLSQLLAKVPDPAGPVAAAEVGPEASGLCAQHLPVLWEYGGRPSSGA